MELVRAPEQFQVLATTNLFGDIPSDEASMLVGGLGVACSGNIGDHLAVFEPVHGSALRLAGLGQANPSAALFSAALMLDYLGEAEQATRLRRAVETCLALAQATPDLGGSLSTLGMTERVVERLM
jgi:homoisocitrate dehydrogenase